MQLTDVLAELFRSRPDLSKSSKRNFKGAVSAWTSAKLTTNMTKIKAVHFVRFRLARTADGRSPYTVESQIWALRYLFVFAGPKTTLTPHSLGWIDTVVDVGKPLVRPRRVKSAWTTQALSSVYEVAGIASYPSRHMPAPQFWRSTLVVAYNTGLRYHDLFNNFRRSRWDRDARTIVVPMQKTGHELSLPVNGVLTAHLDWLPEVEDRFLPQPTSCSDPLRKQLRELCEVASVPYQAFHAMRRAAGQAFDRVERGLGAMLLGHTHSVTERSYIPSGIHLLPAAEKIEQPPAFLAGMQRILTDKWSESNNAHPEWGQGHS